MGKNTQLRSKLSQARGLGSAKEGVHHWWLQRLTAIALAPLGVWFAASLMKVAQSADPFTVADWLGSPWNALFLLLFTGAAFWHARLGLQVVIEDYVHAKPAKYTLLILNTFFCVAAAALCTLSVLKLHMMHIVSGF